MVVFFERTKRFSSCHFTRKHFFSADIIKDGIGRANSTPAERTFALKRLIGPRWQVEEPILTDGHFPRNLIQKQNKKLRVCFYFCDESWGAGSRLPSKRSDLISFLLLMSSLGMGSRSVVARMVGAGGAGQEGTLGNLWG